MRGLIIFGVFLVVAVTAVTAAQAGVLAWVWIALMNPHKEVYGFDTGLRLNNIIAIIAVLSWLISSERKAPGDNNSFWLAVFFFLWTSLSTLFAWNAEFSYPYWLEFAKTLTLIFLVATVLNTRLRIHALLLIIFISLAYWGVKGGGFSILSGGRYLVYGPASSHIADNNHLALALTMTLPVGYFLFRQSEHKLTRWAVAGASTLTLISVLISYSRGAFVALAAMALYWMFTRRQIKSIAATVIIGGLTFILLPDQWFDRMETIGEYSEDRSAQGRLDAWRTSFNMAKADPLTGAGFTAIERPDVYFSHNPDSILGASKAAHSIYFQVLGDHGFVGLFIYLSIALLAWRNTQRLSRSPPGTQRDDWIIDITLALKLSLIGFWVGGAFLSMAYYDLYFILVVVTGILTQIQTGSTHKVDGSLMRQLDPRRSAN